jgi:hypothetical protein
VHDIYLALNLMHEAPETVQADGTYHAGALVGASIQLKFGRGSATITVGWTALAPTREMHILNGKREFFWRDSDPQALMVRTAHEERARSYGQETVVLSNGATAREEIITDLVENTVAVEDAAFLTALDDRHPLVGPDEGPLTVAIMEKAQMSIRKRKEVTV